MKHRINVRNTSWTLPIRHVLPLKTKQLPRPVPLVACIVACYSIFPTSAAVYRLNRWPGGVVPYEFDDNAVPENPLFSIESPDPLDLQQLNVSRIIPFNLRSPFENNGIEDLTDFQVTVITPDSEWKMTDLDTAHYTLKLENGTLLNIYREYEAITRKVMDEWEAVANITFRPVEEGDLAWLHIRDNANGVLPGRNYVESIGPSLGGERRSYLRLDCRDPYS